MLKSFFSKTKTESQGLKLKFDKQEKMWQVLKGHSIMFIGQEEQCRIYMSNFN